MTVSNRESVEINPVVVVRIHSGGVWVAGRGLGDVIIGPSWTGNYRSNHARLEPNRAP